MAFFGHLLSLDIHFLQSALLRSSAIHRSDQLAGHRTEPNPSPPHGKPGCQALSTMLGFWHCALYGVCLGGAWLAPRLFAPMCSYLSMASNANWGTA